MKPKVVLLTMFEPDAETPGELAVFRERENLSKIDLPGIDHLYGNAERGLYSLLTGVGTASTAVSVMGLVLGSGWDFRETLWIVCGIAGGNPAQCSLGSPVWADWVVDGDLAHEIDPREAPQEWPTGIFPLGARAPYAATSWYHQLQGPAYQEFCLHKPLVDWAYSLTKDTPLLNPPELPALRKGYPQHPAADKPPAVLRGDTLSGGRYWHGALANTWAEQWVRYWTKGNGTFYTSAMEDTGTLLALTQLAEMGKVNDRNILILRSVSNYTMPPEGVSAAENICDDKSNHLPAMAAALENGYRVVKRVLDAVCNPPTAQGGQTDPVPRLRLAHELLVYFTVRGDFAAADFIHCTGLTPDVIREKGSALPSGRPRPETACDFIIRSEECRTPIPDYSTWLARITPASDALANYIRAKRLHACLQFVPKLYVNSEDSLPAIALDEEIVQLLAKLNASVDVDLYQY